MNRHKLVMGPLCLLVIACSSLDNKGVSTPTQSGGHSVTGEVTATAYNVPVQAQLSFYLNGELINETYSEKSGKYEIRLPNHYFKKEAFVVVGPSSKSNTMDTTSTQITGVVAHCSSTDTIPIRLSKDQRTIPLKLRTCILEVLEQPIIEH